MQTGLDKYHIYGGDHWPVGLKNLEIVTYFVN